MRTMDYRNTDTDETITESEAWEAYDEWLDGIDGDVTVGSLTFAASRVVKELDPIAYRVGFADWLDAEGWDEG